MWMSRTFSMWCFRSSALANDSRETLDSWISFVATRLCVVRQAHHEGGSELQRHRQHCNSWLPAKQTTPLMVSLSNHAMADCQLENKTYPRSTNLAYSNAVLVHGFPCRYQDRRVLDEHFKGRIGDAWSAANGTPRCRGLPSGTDGIKSRRTGDLRIAYLSTKTRFDDRPSSPHDQWPDAKAGVARGKV